MLLNVASDLEGYLMIPYVIIPQTLIRKPLGGTQNILGALLKKKSVTANLS
jgi:hypothetical protein